MAKDVLITPLDGIIQFSSSAGAGTGQVKVDGDDLVISNLVGDVLLGDGASDVFIGNGSDNVDIVFEQNGEIRDDGSGKSITLGSKTTTVFISSSTDLTLQETGGNVGIGTAAAGEVLEVIGNITASGAITSSGLHTTGVISASGTGHNYFGGHIKFDDQKGIFYGSKAAVQYFDSSDLLQLGDSAGSTEVRIFGAGSGGTINSFRDGGLDLGGHLTSSGAISASAEGTSSFGMGFFDGKVGVGTTSPSMQLEVVAPANGGILVNRDATTLNSPVEVGFRHTTSEGDAALGMRSYRTNEDDSYDHELRFFTTAGSGGQVEHLTIKHNGKVGVGTTGPSSSLDVNGDLNVQSHISSSGNISGSGFIGGTLTLKGLSNQGSEATAVMINGSSVVGTRELGSNAFTSTTIGTTTNALTVDNATIQLNTGTTFNGSAARTISVKDGGIDSDALAADIAVTNLAATDITSSGAISASIIRAKEIRDHNNGHLTIRPDADLNLGTAGTDEINIGRTDSTTCDLQVFAGDSSPTLRIVNQQIILDGHITASANISASATSTGSFGRIEIDDDIAIGGTTITSTAAELNILDGDLAASNITPVDADRVVFNDDGTMKQVTMAKLATYFDDEITNMPNLADIGTNLAIDGTLDVSSHITASGNISASGNIIAPTFSGSSIRGGTPDSDDVSLFMVSRGGGGMGIFDSGKVRIGSVSDTDTDDQLQVIGSITASGNVNTKGDLQLAADSFIRLDYPTTGDNQIRYSNSQDLISIKSDQIYLDADNGVGVGTFTPTKALQVQGDISGSGTGSFGKLAVAETSLTQSISTHGTFNIHYGTNAEFTGSLSAAGGYGEIISNFGVHTELGKGDICYLIGQTWRKADADGEASTTKMLGVCLEDGNSGGGQPVLIRGVARLKIGHINDTSGDEGDLLYLSTTAGKVQFAAPSDSGEFVRIVGYCLQEANDIIYFDPDKSFVEVA